MLRFKLLVLLVVCTSFHAMAGNGDSIFNMVYIHDIHITFPYTSFYDSLINTNTTDAYIPVTIQFNNKTLDSVGIKVKGNSSFNNPSQKKSFKLDFNEFVSGQDLHGLKKLNFNNSFKDPSFMREKLVNDFLIAHHLPAPRTTYCNVYFNNQLWGLYTIVEEVDDEFCKHWFSNNNNNLFKGDPHGSLQWKGSNTQSLYESDYELKNNQTQYNWNDLITLIDQINNGPISNLYNSLEPKLNTTDFLKQWASMNLFSSLDSYIGSGHNYYLYHDSSSDKFQFIAWDNNEAFGGFKLNLSSSQLKTLDMYYLSTPTNARPLCDRMLQYAVYKEQYNQAYCELAHDFTNAWFDPKIDSLRNVIQSSVYNDPKKFYPNTKFDSSFNYDVVISGGQTMVVFGLKNFISERATSIQSSIATNQVTCWPLASTHVFEEEKEIRLFPNPACNSISVSNASKQVKQVVSYLGTVVYEGVDDCIATKHWSNGLYCLRCNGRSIPFVIQH